MISRCDSAAIVPNTSELLPDPETPVNTVSRRFGISTLTSLRLFTRAPCTRIRSWLSAAGHRPVVVVLRRPGLAHRLSVVGALVGRVRAASAQLLDAEHVAGGIADGAVAHAVRLVDRLLHDLGAAGLQLLEGGVEVGRWPG